MLINTGKFLSMLAIAGAAFFVSCSDAETSAGGSQNARLQVMLTDAPDPNVKEVWVDIEGVQINREDSTGNSWVTLAGSHPGVYNLLELTNGQDTLLSDAEIPAGRISQLRLMLGSDNYVILNDGSRVDLETPSAQQSGLKVNVNQTVGGGLLYRLVLDFDAGRSIIRAGNSGRYILKPVLRIISFVPSGGNVKGVVLPDSIRTAVYAIQGTDTLSSTFTDTLNGNWMISDLAAGAYNFRFVPADSVLQPASRSVSITLGQTTVVDTVRLQ